MLKDWSYIKPKGRKGVFSPRVCSCLTALLSEQNEKRWNCFSVAVTSNSWTIILVSICVKKKKKGHHLCHVKMLKMGTWLPEFFPTWNYQLRGWQWTSKMADCIQYYYRYILFPISYEGSIRILDRRRMEVDIPQVFPLKTQGRGTGVICEITPP